MRLADLADEGHHMASDIAFGKPSGSVSEKVLPFSRENIKFSTIPETWMIL
jgi:hypothetical protein